ncbi:Os03g0311850 [Oryza sativa Japonica Group]|uniref:Os03g0311850 protein n=1 Tax=Oryza sativa subsp. japonica TaxID=39947 RepID=A0A0P0VWM5_ORYSJ|nr:Os03g0311850 [Oryza sativa Japonica Group]
MGATRLLATWCKEGRSRVSLGLEELEQKEDWKEEGKMKRERKGKWSEAAATAASPGHHGHTQRRGMRRSRS